MRSRGLLAVACVAAMLAGCTSSKAPTAGQTVSSNQPVTTTRSSRPEPNDAAKIGFPAHCRIRPEIDGLPSDARSGEARPIVRAIHAHCFAVLGSPLDDAVLQSARRVVVGVHWPAADAKGQRLFFFDHQRPIGTDMTSYLPMVVSTGATGPDAFTAHYLGVGSYAGTAVGGGGMLDVRYTWPGKGRPETTDHMPSRTYPHCPTPNLKSNKSPKAHTNGLVTCWY